MKFVSIIYALLALVAIIYILIWEFRHKSLSVFLWATLLFMFGLTNFRDSIIGNNLYNEYVIAEASIFVFVFSIIYLFLRRYFIKRRCNEYLLQFDNEDSNIYNCKYYIFIVFLLIVTFYKAYTFTSSGINILDASWSDGRDILADTGYINWAQIMLPLYFLSSGVFLFSIIYKKRVMSVCIAMLILFNVMITKNKIEILPFLVGAIFAFLFLQRLTLKKIFPLLLLGFFSIYLVYALQVFRHYGSIYFFIEDFDFIEFNKRIIAYVSDGKSEVGFYNDFYYFVKNNNEFINFGEGHSYLRVLLFFIPTAFSFGFKPPDFAISMCLAIDSSLIGGSVHPTLFGDCYANLGFVGLTCLPLFWALIVTCIDAISRRMTSAFDHCLFITLASSFFTIVARGAVYNGFTILIIGSFLLISYNFIQRIKFI